MNSEYNILVGSLILDMLEIDDESINTILKETKIEATFKNRLLIKYREYVISEEEIINAIKCLIKNGYISILDEKGNLILETYNKSVISSKNNIFCRITKKGSEYYKSIYNVVWNE